MDIFESYAYDKTENELHIFLPGGEGWFRYTLRHIVKPFTDGGTHQNQDLWRLHKLYLCQKTGSGFDRIYDFPITNNGEWECAFKITDTPDFHGGFHGYEHQTAFTVTPHAKRLEILQDSEIYLQGTRKDLVALHRKHYRFENGELVLTQRVDWKRSVHINRAFLPMLPIRRSEGDFLICDTAYDQGQELDISREGHKTSLSCGCNEVRQMLTVSGKQSGITASLTVERPRKCFIQNTAAYNKLYFYYAQDSQVPEGDVWDSTAYYRFTYKSPEGAPGRR